MATTRKASGAAIGKQVIRTDRAPLLNLPFSQAIKVGRFVFVAGQIGQDPMTGELAGPDVRAQTHQALKNVRAILEEAGASLEHVVRAGCFLSDPGLFEDFNEVYREYFQNDPPARTTVSVRFPGDILVEVDVIAVVPE